LLWEGNVCGGLHGVGSVAEEAVGVGLDEVEGDEEVVDGEEGGFVAFEGDVEIEEAMAGAFEFDEAAEVAAPGVFAGVRSGGGDGDDAVGGAVEDEGGREFAADGAEEVVFFGGGGIGEAVEAEAVFGGVQDGIEEDESVGDGVDVREDFLALERTGEEDVRSDGVGAAGATDADDVIGIDVEFGGVHAQPAEGVAGVFDSFDGAGAVLGGDTIIEGDADHATGGEVDAVGGELADLAMIPAAAEEESGDGAGEGAGFFRVGMPEVGVEFFVAEDFVGLYLSQFQQLAIAVNRWGA
jgi:hypothetical protein